MLVLVGAGASPGGMGHNFLGGTRTNPSVVMLAMHVANNEHGPCLQDRVTLITKTLASFRPITV